MQGGWWWVDEDAASVVGLHCLSGISEREALGFAEEKLLSKTVEGS